MRAKCLEIFGSWKHSSFTSLTNVCNCIITSEERKLKTNIEKIDQTSASSRAELYAIDCSVRLRIKWLYNTTCVVSAHINICIWNSSVTSYESPISRSRPCLLCLCKLTWDKIYEVFGYFYIPRAFQYVSFLFMIISR